MQVHSASCIPAAAELLGNAAAEALERMRARVATGGTSQAASGCGSSTQELQEAVDSRLSLALAVLAEAESEQAATSDGTSPVPLRSLVHAIERVAAAMFDLWSLPEQAPAAQLEAAWAASHPRCANLRCANLAGGQAHKKCGACGARYCCTACCVADWREGGHKQLCAAVAAKRRPADVPAIPTANEL